MIIDIIFLTKTSDDFYYKITKEAIETLLESEKEHSFNIKIIESDLNKKFFYNYHNCKTIFFKEEDFNYNKAVNLGLLNSKQEWVAWANNDITFEKNWLSTITKTDEFNLELCSFSCYEPRIHTESQYNIKFNEKNISMGYEARQQLTGWFILTNKRVLDKIGGKLDERFKFWWQDWDYARTLQKFNIPHFLVKDSIIYHKGKISHKLLGDKEKEYKDGMFIIFKKKWHNIKIKNL